GWFYSLLAISTLVFGQSPYQNCLVLGLVQDKEGRKMSKHLGNVVDPVDVIGKFGADAVRWYFYTAGAPWLPSRFYDEAVSEAQRKFMSTLWNTYAFYVLYADIDGFVPSQYPLGDQALTLMDEWVLSRLNTLVGEVDGGLSEYRVTESANAVEAFVDELSNWYVRRCRSRYWGDGMDADKAAAYATLSTVLETLARLLAPFTPFLSEAIYQNVVRSVDPEAPESVHLCDYPAADPAFIKPEVERQMDALVQVVQLGRACRNLAGIKVRQPLARMVVKGASFGQEYLDLARDELNVKEVAFTDDASAFTDYRLKPQLKTLGPRFGKNLGKVSALLAQADGVKAVAGFERGEDLELMLDGEPVRLTRDDVLIETKQRENMVSQESRDVMVGLVTALTPELVREGYARETISKLQTMRKDAGFQVTDRIHARVDGAEELAEALAAYRDLITDVVLADTLNGAAAPDSAFAQDWDINGKPARLAVWKA
ncbi:MAG TPA: DUF5915 domain-containing protein, partial [Candidatus Limnocylindria bacterium]|nr:DUF5915 domain-containing protein [Candidatus Limnocylindria bacterium]